MQIHQDYHLLLLWSAGRQPGKERGRAAGFDGRRVTNRVLSRLVHLWQYAPLGAPERREISGDGQMTGTPPNTECQLTEYDAVRIARAVFFAALQEAASQSPYRNKAVMWLGSTHAESFAYAAGIDPGYLQRWVKAGCPQGKRERRSMDLVPVA